METGIRGTFGAPFRLGFPSVAETAGAVEVVAGGTTFDLVAIVGAGGTTAGAGTNLEGEPSLVACLVDVFAGGLGIDGFDATTF